MQSTAFMQKIVNYIMQIKKSVYLQLQNHDRSCNMTSSVSLARGFGSKHSLVMGRVILSLLWMQRIMGARRAEQAVMPERVASWMDG